MNRMKSFGRNRMYRRVAVGVLGLAGLLSIGTPTFAAHGSKSSSTTNWNQRDTAVYVVSTLNLLRTTNGRPASVTYASRFDITKYSVLADSKVDGLYFVELKRDDGTVFGAYAYQMGWAKPQALTSSVKRYGAKRAPSDIVSDYKSDPKTELATFTSTVPQ
jgi:hypothetical protein